MKCGREPGGIDSEKLSICPATTAEKYTGVNRGINAGRFCWKVVGTMCFETIRGVSTLEIISCSQCSFFKKVQEEGKNFS